jgi:type II restriction/modification system DNA methylase subunit YeeA
VRACNFLSATFGKNALQENLRFIKESLGKDLREYFLNSFFRDHLQTYKKRPIYWLFSSGKQKAFQCLVYLHRYNEGTLARMRTEYVIKLQGKITTRIEQLGNDIDNATSTSHRKKLEKERDRFKKQQLELQQFDEKLRHYADLRINLDLDDGVKINYGKFGDLLADVKVVTGTGSDD